MNGTVVVWVFDSTDPVICDGEPDPSQLRYIATTEFGGVHVDREADTVVEVLAAITLWSFGRGVSLDIREGTVGVLTGVQS